MYSNGEVGESSVEQVRMDDLHLTQNVSQGVTAIIGHTNASLYRYTNYT
jgi:hypothetical protein